MDTPCKADTWTQLKTRDDGWTIMSAAFARPAHRTFLSDTLLYQRSVRSVGWLVGQVSRRPGRQAVRRAVASSVSRGTHRGVRVEVVDGPRVNAGTPAYRSSDVEVFQDQALV